MHFASICNICSRGFDCFVVIRMNYAYDILANQDMSFDYESDSYTIVSDDSRRIYRCCWPNWAVTACACTLGAPFWFDALSKLVKLRSSGAPADQGDEFALKPRIAMSDALNDAERALDTDGVKRMQRGIEMAEADVSGWFDGATRQAIAAWQRRMALEPVTGELSISQIASLLSTPQSDDPAPTNQP